MTPPKPLTEKELTDIQAFLQDRNRSWEGKLIPYPESTYMEYLRVAIAELKRLRSGQAREKILRDALEYFAREPKTYEEEMGQDKFIRNFAKNALNEADEIKDEENRK